MYKKKIIINYFNLKNCKMKTCVATMFAALCLIALFGLSNAEPLRSFEISRVPRSIDLKDSTDPAVPPSSEIISIIKRVLAFMPIQVISILIQVIDLGDTVYKSGHDLLRNTLVKALTWFSDFK